MTSAPLLPWPFRLDTPRLALHASSAARAAELHQAINESLTDLARWLPWASHAPSLEETTERCAKGEAEFRDGREFKVHLLRRDTGRFAGMVGIRPLALEVPSCDFGYWVRSDEGGQGFVTEAVRALVDELEAHAGVLRIEIRMDSRNLRSRAVPERLGFDLEGILRADARHADGSLRDTCVYARVRGESGARNEAPPAS